MIYRGRPVGKKGHFCASSKVARVQISEAPGAANLRRPSPGWNALRFRFVAPKTSMILRILQMRRQTSGMSPTGLAAKDARMFSVGRPKTLPPDVTHQTLEQAHMRSTQGSIFPVVPSVQFQSQMSCLHGESVEGSTTGDHLFKARSGFAQVKPADESKNGSVATQTIINVY